MPADAPQQPDPANADKPDPNAPPAEELKRAMKAFKKRLKLARLDAESTLGRGAMSGGKDSGIVAIAPPHQYPKEIWEELVRRGRLKYVGQGLYEQVMT